MPPSPFKTQLRVRICASTLRGSDTVMPTHNRWVRERFARVLKARHVAVHTRAEVTEVSPGCLHTRDGRTFDADETLWVTQAGGPAWLQGTGLALDALPALALAAVASSRSSSSSPKRR